MPVYLDTVKCNERLTKIIHPLSLSHVFAIYNKRYGLSHSQSFSPLEALRNVRKPHTQVDYIPGNLIGII